MKSCVTAKVQSTFTKYFSFFLKFLSFIYLVQQIKLMDLVSLFIMFTSLRPYSYSTSPSFSLCDICRVCIHSSFGSLVHSSVLNWRDWIHIVWSDSARLKMTMCCSWQYCVLLCVVRCVCWHSHVLLCIPLHCNPLDKTATYHIFHV